MESIYEKLDSNKIGEIELLHITPGIFYEFTKIREYQYLVQLHILLENKEIQELNGTMTTIEASMLYEKMEKDIKVMLNN